MMERWDIKPENLLLQMELNKRQEEKGQEQKEREEEEKMSQEEKMSHTFFVVQQSSHLSVQYCTVQ